MKATYPSLFFILMISILVYGCKKGSNKNGNETEIDQLSDTQQQQLETAGIDTTTKFKDAVYADGTNIKAWMTINDSSYFQQYNSGKKTETLSAVNAKTDFIGRITEAGFYYANRPIQSGLHTGQPNGLAYVYQSKQVDQPHLPCCGTSTCSTACNLVCNTALYGLDAAGLITVMANTAGVSLSSPNGIGTAQLIDTAVWGNAFRNSTSFQTLTMADLGNLPPNQIQAGDIIVEPGVHCGIWIDNGSNKGFINCPGKAENSCTQNSDLQHGPLISANALSWLATIFGANYHVMRISATTEDDCGICADVDGNVYRVVRIGTQCWMAENLKTTRYRDGSAITEVEDSLDWANIYYNHTSVAAWCYYASDISNDALYGKLYNGYAISDSRGVCPAGWHVPDSSEFITLVDYLGGASVAGGPMKSTTGWTAPNTGATNASGFSALPGGMHHPAYFLSVGQEGNFWSSTPKDSSRNYYWTASYNGTLFDYVSADLAVGYSCRCVKDH